MKLQKPILFILFMLGFYAVYAGNHIVPKPVRKDVHPGGQFINHSDWNFAENKGQLPPDPLKGETIKYYGHQGGVYLYCEPGKISFVFTKVENNQNQVSEATGSRVETQCLRLNHASAMPYPPLPQDAFNASLQNHPSAVTTSRTLPAIALATADLILFNSNPNAQIIASDQQEYYENYYTANTPEEGITNVHTYKTITYKSIYPNIDMVLHAKPNGMKYEFVVYPGGNVDDIQIQWNGLESIKKLKDSKIEYSCSLGKMEENKPVSFQGQNSVISDFVKTHNRICFNVESYDKTKPLIIDPILEWGTYFGGSEETISGGVAVDKTGNVYATGRTLSSSGIATSGAFLTYFPDNGGYSTFITKFNNTGKIQWATYFGGNKNDFGLCIAVDSFGSVFITGYTGSTSGLATSGAYQTSLSSNSNPDVFLAKFNGSGKRLWSTYYGGNNGANSFNGGGSSVATDIAGNVYITGYTISTSGIATKGAFQTAYGGDSANMWGDAFLAKFNNNGTIQWATYFGGRESDQGVGVSTDNSGNVFIVGSTQSDNGIATKGAYQTSLVGGNDAFIAKFNASGTIQYATYYGLGTEVIYGISNDISGNFYIAGQTSSATGIATKGSYQTSYGGETDALLVKFNNNGALQWATYYGGNEMDAGYGVSADIFGNVYIVGFTSSTSGIATKGAYQTTLRPYYDDFIAKFSGSGAIQWGSYYGGKNIIGSSSVATDNFGNTFISGSTNSTSGVATNGAYQTYFVDTANNIVAFLAKFGNFVTNDAGISSILNPKNYFCADTQTISVQLHNYGTVDLDSVTIHFTSNGKPITVYHWKGNLLPDSSVSVSIGRFLFPVGKDTIKSWTSNPNGVTDSVPENDTSTSIVDVLAPPGLTISPNKSICTNSSDTIGTIAVVSNLYSWSSNPAGFHSTSPRAVVSPSAKTTYYLTVTSTITGCSNSDSVTISLIPLPQVNTGLAKTICEDSVITIGAASTNGYSYSWTSNPAGFSSAVSKPNVNPIKTTTYYLTVTDNATGCSNSDSVIVSVNPAPPVNLGANDTICAGSSVTIGVTASGAYSYGWTSNPSGFSSTTSENTVSPGKSTAYTLFVTNIKTGCSNAKSIDIIVNPLPVPKIDSTHFTICTGSHIRIGGNSETGMAYSWSSIPAGFTSTSSGPIVNPGGNITYFLTETNINTGCSSSDSAKVIVTVPKAPVSSPGFNQTICSGNIAVLGADPLAGITYSWTSDPPGFISTSPKAAIKPDTTTTYYLTVKNSIGCTDLGTVTVHVNPLPVVSAGLPETVCSGTMVQLGSLPVGGDSYSWSSIPTGFQSAISNPIDSPNVTTEYSVKGTIDSSGCSNSDSVLISVVPRPNVQFAVKNINGFEYQFAAKNPNYPAWQYQWEFGDSTSGKSDTTSGYNVSHTYTQIGKYKVVMTVSLPGFCTETNSYEIIINEQFALNIFPNPFETQTDINYTLVNPGHVRISVVDEIGRQLGVLVDKQLNQGEYNTYYDAALWKTRSAMYFVVFHLDDKVIVKKIIQLDSIYH